MGGLRPERLEVIADDLMQDAPDGIAPHSTEGGATTETEADGVPRDVQVDFLGRQRPPTRDMANLAYGECGGVGSSVARNVRRHTPVVNNPLVMTIVTRHGDLALWWSAGDE